MILSTFRTRGKAAQITHVLRLSDGSLPVQLLILDPGLQTRTPGG